MQAALGQFLFLPLCIYMLIDSILSWNDLGLCPKPMNVWYIIFSSAMILLTIVSLLTNIILERIHPCIRRTLEVFMFLLAVFILTWIIVGYTWLIESWIEDTTSIPVRYKILFLGILIIFSLQYLPIIVISIIVLIKIVSWQKKQGKKKAMAKKLKKIQQKMYNSKFNFMKIQPELTIEFFQQPLQQREIEILQSEFTQKIEDPSFLPADSLCPVCFSEFLKDDQVMTVPVCKHQYHKDCILPWFKNQNNCPSCRSVIRVNMIKHYHGEFELPVETTNAVPNQDNGTDSTQNDIIELRINGIDVPIMERAEVA